LLLCKNTDFLWKLISHVLAKKFETSIPLIATFQLHLNRNGNLLTENSFFMALKSVNPATGETLKTFKEEYWSSIQEKLHTAAEYFSVWKSFAFPVRSKYLEKVAEILLQKKEFYATLITQEMGKPLSESRAEIEKCALVCKYFARETKLFLREDLISTESDSSHVSFEPLGILLGIMPWNFPFWQVFRFAAPALMAGNVILLKHASNVPQCSLAIDQLFREAGAPKGMFQSLLTTPYRARKLLQDDRVRAVSLTGSLKAGAEIAEAAGKNIKKSVLELGGSDPFIVMKDANLKRAAETAVFSRMLNAGQSCIAAKRFIVEQDVYKSFMKLLKKEMHKLKPGDPMKEKTKLGPLAREDLLKTLQRQLKYSIKKGAKLEMGGVKIKGKGYFYPATILCNVNEDMPVFKEEVFGPVASVMQVKDEAEAIRIANHSDFGLGASVWTENHEQALRMAKKIEAGNIFVNSMVRSDPRLPFGGIKKSGYGRELGAYGIREFVNIKTIVID